VHLQPAEAGTVAFESLHRDISFWDVQSQAWVIPAMKFEFLGGFSSRDVADAVSRRVLQWVARIGGTPTRSQDGLLIHTAEKLI